MTANKKPDSIRIPLKPEFREPLRKKIGFFGRQAEVARLVSIFTGRVAATVLISGHRGVGKSALVEHALDRVADGSDKSLIVSKLTLPHVETVDSSEQRVKIRDQVLRSSARALYFELQDSRVDKQVRERAEALYEKTYLKELAQETVVGSIARQESRAASSTVHETELSPSEGLSNLLAGFGGAGAGIAGIALVSSVATAHGLAWGIVAALATAASIVAGIFGFRKIKAEEKSKLRGLTQTDTRSRTGSFDVSSETLEFELRRLLSELSEAGHRCVFVVDELDKLPAQKVEGLEHHPIFLIISSLKNFFTLGFGIFVFITGDDFYRDLQHSMGEGDYTLAHTLFTDRVFIHALHYSALEELIDNLLVDNNDRDVRYRQLRNYLCWISHNHIFDLLSAIGNFVVYENDKPVLVAEPAGARQGRWREGTLPENWVTCAGMQKVIGAAFDDHARPASQEELFNQTLWRLLRQVGQQLVDGMVLELENDEYTLPDADWKEPLRTADVEDLEGAVRRFLAKLERHGMVEKKEESAKKPAASGQSQSVRQVV